MCYRSILQILVVCFFAVSCTGQGVEPKNKTLRPSQTAKTQAKKLQKLDPAEKVPQNYVPGEILIRFMDGTDAQRVKAIQAELHLKIIRLVKKPNLYLMKIVSGEPVERVIKQLQDYKEVQYSEPNYMRSIN